MTHILQLYLRYVGWYEALYKNITKMTFNPVQRTYVTIPRIDTVMEIISVHCTCEMVGITWCGRSKLGQAIEQL